MSKTKRWLSMLLVVALVAGIAISGTLAYLTSEDGDVNVMTLGNVEIEQIEEQLAADGTTEPFEQAKDFYPGTEISKIVTVKNIGRSDAYFRTLIAFEDIDSDTFGINFGFTDTAYTIVPWGGEPVSIEIDGVNYVVYEFIHKTALPVGETSEPSLLKVDMKNTATNEDMELLGDTYEILVLSQAVQTAGFSDAATALDTAFGDVTAENAKAWFAGLEFNTPVIADNAEELQEALDNAAEGNNTIILTGDIEGDLVVTQKADSTTVIEGNGNTFDGVIVVDGKSKTYTSAGFTIKNVDFKADNISADACIRLGDGTNATRYTCNVTIENCTFDVPGAVGIKSYTGGDKNLTIRGCTATANAHSLVQAKGIDGILVENCTVNSKNGMNFNNSTNVTVLNCNADVKGYAVRFGESSGGAGTAETYLIKDCTLKSANDGGDAVIVLRGTADYSTLTIVNTTITGTPDITNTATGATVIK